MKVTVEYNEGESFANSVTWTANNLSTSKRENIAALECIIMDLPDSYLKSILKSAKSRIVNAIENDLGFI